MRFIIPAAMSTESDISDYHPGLRNSDKGTHPSPPPPLPRPALPLPTCVLTLDQGRTGQENNQGDTWPLIPALSQLGKRPACLAGVHLSSGHSVCRASTS